MGDTQLKQTRSNSTNYQFALAQFFTFAALCEDGKGEAALLDDTIREAVVTAARELAHYNEHYKASREMSRGGILGEYMTILDHKAAQSRVMADLATRTSPARAAASAENGKKGGRPRKNSD